MLAHDGRVAARRRRPHHLGVGLPAPRRQVPRRHRGAHRGARRPELRAAARHHLRERHRPLRDRVAHDQPPRFAPEVARSGTSGRTVAVVSMTVDRTAPRAAAGPGRRLVGERRGADRPTCPGEDQRLIARRCVAGQASSTWYGPARRVRRGVRRATLGRAGSPWVAGRRTAVVRAVGEEDGRIGTVDPRQRPTPPRACRSGAGQSGCSPTAARADGHGRESEPPTDGPCAGRSSDPSGVDEIHHRPHRRIPDTMSRVSGRSGGSNKPTRRAHDAARSPPADGLQQVYLGISDDPGLRLRLRRRRMSRLTYQIAPGEQPPTSSPSAPVVERR